MFVGHRALLRPIQLPPAIAAVRTLCFRPTTPISLPRRILPSSSFLAKRQKPLRTLRSSSRERLLPPLPFIGPLDSIDNDKFDELLPPEQIRRCFNLPVPTTCERLRDPRLDALFFNDDALKTMSKGDRKFLQAYHLQPLEFVGDRIWSALTSKVLFLSLPPGGSNVGPLHVEIAAKLARELGLASHRIDEKPAADRFEAYLTALEFANGYKSLLKFLVPLIRREYFARFDSMPSLNVSPIEGLQDQTTPPLPETNSSASSISPPNLSDVSPIPASPTLTQDTKDNTVQSIEPSPAFPLADPQQKPTSDRRVYYMRPPRSSLSARRKLQQKFVRIDRLNVEIHVTLPEQGPLLGFGASQDEAAEMLFAELLKYGLVTQNAEIPIQRKVIPFNYNGIETLNFLLTPDLDRLAKKTNGSLRWSQSLHLPGWDPIVFEGSELVGNVKIKSLFEAAVELGAIQITDASDLKLHQNYDLSRQSADEAAACDELSRKTSEKGVEQSDPSSNETDDLEIIGDIANSAKVSLATHTDCSEPSSGPSFATSTLSPPLTLRPRTCDTASASTPISRINATASLPPHQVTSSETAYREIEAIPGCEVDFTVKVFLPGYGMAEASDARPSRARTMVMKELMRLGAVTRSRRKTITTDSLPFNYHDSYFYLYFDLEEVCRDLPKSSIEWEWSIIFPNRPKLSLKAMGRDIRKIHTKYLVQAALKAGFIEIKAPEEPLPPLSPLPSTTIDRSLPTKLTPSPFSSSPSFLDALSESSSTDTTALTPHSSAAAKTPNDLSPSTSIEHEKS